LIGEEWSGEGRVLELTGAERGKAGKGIEVKEIKATANLNHEGFAFSADGKTFYYGDEDNSGSIFKFVMDKLGDMSCGENFVLIVDAFSGDVTKNWNDPSNVGKVRTGSAHWETIGRFCKGEKKDYKNYVDTNPYKGTGGAAGTYRGGRIAADEIGGTPYGRPEHFAYRVTPSGEEQLFFTATSEYAIYLVRLEGDIDVSVEVAASDATPKNVGYAETTATLRDPDRLEIDPWGNLYVVEDKPNGDIIGGDIWYFRDDDMDGVAESLDQIACNRVSGSESSGMVWSKKNNDQFSFYVTLQHPASTDLANYPQGFGDAIWKLTMPYECSA
jgi:secreted PhoX family phosphatase